MKSIFLSTPAGIFASMDDAFRCARSLTAMLKYHCSKCAIENTSVTVGISNVNPRKAQYVRFSDGVGKPQKRLVGNKTNCFVKPHLHIIIEGEKNEMLSALVIEYLIKRYKGVSGKGVHIWKQYVLNCETERVLKYILIQSLHVLRTKKSKVVIATKSYEDKTIVKQKLTKKCKVTAFSRKKEEISNKFMLYNLRFQWLMIKQLQMISGYIVNVELLFDLQLHQSKIEKYAMKLKYSSSICTELLQEYTNITIRTEQFRKITIAQKRKFENFMSQPMPEFRE